MGKVSGRGRWWGWAGVIALLCSGVARAQELQAPTDLVVTAIDWNDVTLQWGDASTGESWYAIEGRVAGAPTFDLLTLLPASSTSGTVPLPSVASYELRVRPTLSLWETATLGATTFVSPPAYPAPTNVAATATAYDSIAVVWSDSSTDEGGFFVEVRAPGATEWTQATSTGPGITSADVWWLAQETTYEVRVRAYVFLYGMTAMTPSAVTTVTTPSYPAPTNVVAVAVDWDELQVTFTDNSDDELGFEVQYRAQGETEWSTGWFPSPNWPARTVLGLEASTTYEVRVVPFLFGSWPDFLYVYMTPSETVLVTTPAYPSPTNVVAVAVDWDELAVTFTDNSDDETSFEVQYRAQGETEWSSGWFPSPNWPAVTVLGLEASTTYEVRVVPLLFGGWPDYLMVPMPPSETVLVTTPAYPSPTNVVAVAVDWDELAVTFTDNSDDETSFEVQYRAQGETEWSSGWFPSPNWPAVTVLGLEASTTYEVRVVPLLFGGWPDYLMVPMPPSETVLVTTPAYPSPTNVVAVAVDWDELEVTFTDNSDDELGFDVQWRVQGATEWSTGWFPSPNWPARTVLGLEPSTTYEVRVVPTLFSGWPDYLPVPMTPSATVLVTTPAYPSPTDVEAIAIDSDEVEVTFTDESDDEDGFEVQYRVQGETEWSSGWFPSPNWPARRIAGLEAQTTYEVRVVPFLFGGWPDYLPEYMPPSEIVIVTTP